MHIQAPAFTMFLPAHHHATGINFELQVGSRLEILHCASPLLGMLIMLAPVPSSSSLALLLCTFQVQAPACQVRTCCLCVQAMTRTPNTALGESG